MSDSQIAVLREALEQVIKAASPQIMGNRQYFILRLDSYKSAKEALTATAEAAEKWEAEMRADVVAQCQRTIYEHPAIDNESLANDLCAALEQMKEKV